MLGAALVVILTVCCGLAAANAQTAAQEKPAAAASLVPPAAGTPASGTQSAAPDPLTEPSGFAYVQEGRRDPFISLLQRGSDSRSASGSRPAGLAGLGADEVTLRGTIRSRDGFVGILQGADSKTYIVRAGDRLFDGTVRMISQNDMVIVQQVNDPLSLDKQREVRKMLRQIEAN